MDDQDHGHKCRLCTKSFPCGRSLGGHMRSHVPSNGYGLRDNPKKTWRLSGREEKPRPAACIAGTSSSLSSEDYEEQEDVAISLMMLSRDVGYWGDPISENESDGESRGRTGRVAKLGKRRYECATCNKRFQSYQALGGHRASHKRLKGCRGESSLEVVRGSHQCGICGKAFASGQALGGHKRTHFATSSPTVAAAEDDGSIDLNLPAAVDEDSSNGRGSADAEFDCWWAGSDPESEAIANR